jgi:hypothetical protein
MAAVAFVVLKFDIELEELCDDGWEDVGERDHKMMLGIVGRQLCLLIEI